MKKRMYRRVRVKDVSVEDLLGKLPEPVVIVALDVAKHAMVAAFAGAEAGVAVTVSFRHPDQSATWLALISGLLGVGKRVEAVMEPSGSYGDALRHQLRELGAVVYRVGSKRTHDAAELFDAVPSMHDAKAAAVIVRLHLSGLSTPWVEPAEWMRELSAALDVMALHQEHYPSSSARSRARRARARDRRSARCSRHDHRRGAHLRGRQPQGFRLHAGLHQSVRSQSTGEEQRCAYR
jgi:hypothetical protein